MPSATPCSVAGGDARTTLYGPDQLGFYRTSLEDADRMGYPCDIVGRGMAGRRRRYIWMDIEAPRPWSLQQEVVSCMSGDRARSTGPHGPRTGLGSLHMAGLDSTGHVTRLHLMGQAGRPGLEQVEGED
jgi:hypothetical protein